MKKYYQDLEELNKANLQKQDNDDSPDVSLLNMLGDKANTNRRDFLKLFGFSVASATVLSSCEKPVTKAIPYLIKPETVTPGKADYYASTFFDGEHYSSILVKVRDGRPIKIEGNELSPLTQGSSSAIAQASVLELYDDNRIQQPLKKGKPINWSTADAEIKEKLNSIKKRNGKIVLLSSTIISPSTKYLIQNFQAEFPYFEHVVYDSASVSGMLDANEKNFNKRTIPGYNFDKAEVIVSFGADFLGNWLSPTEFTKGYIAGRKLDDGEKQMLQHFQYETGMSLTGSNADYRIPIKPSEEKLALATLYKKLLNLLGENNSVVLPKCNVEVENAAKQLFAHKGKSIVLSGSNDVNSQQLVNAINQLLGNYGTTIDFTRELRTKQGNDKELKQLIKDIDNGEIDALLCYNCNPAFDFPGIEAFSTGIQKLALSVSFANSHDETSSVSKYVFPDCHFLESWNDANPVGNYYSLAQPAIRNLFDTRQFQDTLLSWMGKSVDYSDFIKEYWTANLFSKSKGYVNFTDFWNHSLQDGVFELSSLSNAPSYISGGVDEIIKAIKLSESDAIELHFYENNTIGTGKHSNNPWLHETPDAISKVCWDNYAAVSPNFAADQGLETGDIIALNNDIEIPVLIQPGQKYNTLSVAIGYGREVAGKAGKGVGVNINKLLQFEDNFRASFTKVEIQKTGKKHLFAITQTHNSMEGRPLIRETTLEEYIENQGAGNEWHEKVSHHLNTLYEEHKYDGHHWGMTVDLNSCIGCNACVVGCTAENNVPVVGKEEVRRVHEMHWIRIDRYYAGDPENPEVARQPVMCQHCDNAPCENVCPVAATTHSEEGINQMAYNRCIGTRYCNNNCPYKVRRFNWFDYTQADALPGNTMDPAGMTLDLPRMVLNPDVTVRAKGVMEKCSFCIQRIQDKKLEAKLEGRPLADGELKTACQQACPTKAITFGDMSDPDSRVTQLMKTKRNYNLLEELHTLPSVGYLTKVRNKKREVVEDKKDLHGENHS
jgi:molybdopterin-containing oxidoreductase family iron-sulfur binding subunit